MCKYYRLDAIVQDLWREWRDREIERVSPPKTSTEQLDIFIEDIHQKETPIIPAHPSTQLLPFYLCCYPSSPRLRPCIRHMGLEEMGIELAAGRLVF